MAKMTKCPKCGSEEFYVSCYIRGSTIYNYRFDGRPADNTGLHEPLDYEDGKRAYCSECRAYLGKAAVLKEAM